MNGNMLDEPDTVGAAVKDMTFAVHLAGENGKQHRLSMPGADFHRDARLGREVDMVARHLEEALGADGIKETGRGAVVEDLRRLLRRVFQLNLDGMTLAGPDARAIRAELEALL